MALVLADRVQEYSTTTGTGTLTLSGAYAGFQTFAAGIGNGNTCYYTITSDTNQWEVGIGTVGVGTLARTTLISSSTGSLVSFVGTLTVFVTYPAEKSVNLDAAGVMSGYAISGGTINGTTVGSTTAAAGSFSTLNSSGATRLGGLSGNQSLQVNNVASAVNYLQAVGAVTTGAPTISALGADTNINAAIAAKGTGSVQLQSSGATVLNVSSSGAGVGDFINIYPTSGFMNWVLAGTDTNIGYVLTTKGGLGFYLSTGGGQQVAISHTASAVNYLQLTGAATGAAPTISAQGSDANINLNLAAKVNGYVYTSNANGIATRFFGGANYLTVGGTGSGSSPTLNPDGVDSNITFVINGKNTGGVALGGSNAGNSGFRVFQTTSSVNYVQVLGAVTTGAPELSAQGSDANINLKLTPKGTGTLQFGTYTAGVVAQAGYITITDAGGTSRRLLVG
jgi:hypothetical protein